MRPTQRAKGYEKRFREYEPMSRHSTWRCGGSARFFFQPKSLGEIVSYMSNLDDKEDIIWVGLGSNLLVRDGGFSGTVISTTKALKKITWSEDNKSLYVQSGVACARVAKESATRDRKGLEFLVGIPGTIGGALKMNAGASGSEIWNFVEEVETIDSKGEIEVFARSNFFPSYRNIKGPSTWFVSARFSLPESAAGTGLQEIESQMARRRATQPIGKSSCGSVFTNPKDDFAGRLIESCNLKGCRIGGAVVSTKHANFILNDGGASATDIEKLILYMRAIVRKKTGVVLRKEVRIVGKAGKGPAIVQHD